MKYLLSCLMVLALAGAGCAQVNSTTESQTRVETDTENAEQGGSEAGVNTQAETEAEVQLEIETEGGSVIVEAVEEGSTETETEVPVIDVVLGGEADVLVDMAIGNFFFNPNIISASPGDRVSLTFTENAGFHTFVIDEINAEFPISVGETFVFTAPTEPGVYMFYCDIGSHRSMGMEGRLIVEQR